MASASRHTEIWTHSVMHSAKEIKDGPLPPAASLDIRGRKHKNSQGVQVWLKELHPKRPDLYKLPPKAEPNQIERHKHRTARNLVIGDRKDYAGFQRDPPVFDNPTPQALSEPLTATRRSSTEVTSSGLHAVKEHDINKPLGGFSDYALPSALTQTISQQRTEIVSSGLTCANGKGRLSRKTPKAVLPQSLNSLSIKDGHARTEINIQRCRPRPISKTIAQGLDKSNTTDKRNDVLLASIGSTSRADQTSLTQSKFHPITPVPTENWNTSKPGLLKPEKETAVSSNRNPFAKLGAITKTLDVGKQALTGQSPRSNFAPPSGQHRWGVGSGTRPSVKLAPTPFLQPNRTNSAHVDAIQSNLYSQPKYYPDFRSHYVPEDHLSQPRHPLPPQHFDPHQQAPSSQRYLSHPQFLPHQQPLSQQQSLPTRRPSPLSNLLSEGRHLPTHRSLSEQAIGHRSNAPRQQPTYNRYRLPEQRTSSGGDFKSPSKQNAHDAARARTDISKQKPTKLPPGPHPQFDTIKSDSHQKSKSQASTKSLDRKPRRQDSACDSDGRFTKKLTNKIAGGKRQGSKEPDQCTEGKVLGRSKGQGPESIRAPTAHRFFEKAEASSHDPSENGSTTQQRATFQVQQTNVLVKKEERSIQILDRSVDSRSSESRIADSLRRENGPNGEVLDVSNRFANHQGAWADYQTPQYFNPYQNEDVNGLKSPHYSDSSTDDQEDAHPGSERSGNEDKIKDGPSKNTSNDSSDDDSDSNSSNSLDDSSDGSSDDDVADDQPEAEANDGEGDSESSASYEDLEPGYQPHLEPEEGSVGDFDSHPDNDEPADSEFDNNGSNANRYATDEQRNELDDDEGENDLDKDQGEGDWEDDGGDGEDDGGDGEDDGGDGEDDGGDGDSSDDPFDEREYDQVDQHATYGQAYRPDYYGFDYDGLDYEVDDERGDEDGWSYD